MTALLTADEAAGLRVGVNVIVRAGDYPKMCPLADPTECSGDFCDCSLHPPHDWVALTGPCPRCGGAGMGYKVVGDRCPDCRDGRRIVPLYTECEACGGDKNSASTCGVLDCFGGKRLVGRGGIEVEPEDDGRNFRITLDVTELA